MLYSTGYVEQQTLAAHVPISNIYSILFRHSVRLTDCAGGADKAAEMTTDTFLTDDTRFAVFSEGDSLVAAVLAGYITTAAADTFLAVNLRENHRLAVEVGWQDDVFQFFTNEFLQLRNTALLHIMLQAEFKVVNDAVTVLHDRRAHLYVAASELDEL